MRSIRFTHTQTHNTSFYFSRLKRTLYLIKLSFFPQLPTFKELRQHYPGYAHFGGVLHNHQLVEAIGCDSQHTDLLLRDTSALRLSAAFNKIGGAHSLGRELIRLSKYGRDSIAGRDGLQYLYHPIAYGPYLADKYGYPTVSKLHQQDALDTEKVRELKEMFCMLGHHEFSHKTNALKG